MTKGSISQRNENKSIKIRNGPFDKVYFEVSDFDASSENDKSTPKNSDPRSPEILSTADLISAVNRAWDLTYGPLSSFLSKTDPTRRSEVIQESEILPFSTQKGNHSSSGYSTSKTNSPKLVELKKLELLTVSQKISYPQIEPCLGTIYGWMHDFAFTKPRNRVNDAKIEDQKTKDLYASSNTTSSCHNLNVGISGSNLELPRNEIVHSSHGKELSSSCHENNVKETSNGPIENEKDHGPKHVQTGPFMHEIGHWPTHVQIGPFEKETKTHYSLAKQEHAFAGAMAGIVVSLCLHPIDTVKTIVQTCRADQKPLLDIGRKIVSERGVTGLYRGISSNIISSAPISAVYTFTYESVKKSLLPILPMEYHSLAHCIAGGSASIATSFIFTPSERIKQQMQVGLHYQNSWNALVEVVKKGGLPSLYAGWGAVLCRNVPHSIIKFYTYEKLKQIMLPSIEPDAQPNTLVTLVCGGLASSTASLFTTPFDVVKTRFQTKIPGSMTQCNGVFGTLIDIGKCEGLKGLYRGLTPRLVMYMIQGALFFASYESFKRLLSLEVQKTRTQKKMERESTTHVSVTA